MWILIFSAVGTLLYNPLNKEAQQAAIFVQKFVREFVENIKIIILPSQTFLGILGKKKIYKAGG